MFPLHSNDAVLPIGFLMGATLTYVFMKIARYARVLDIPNERSSHSAPTPRGGGLAIVVAFVAFLLLNIRFNFVPVEDAVGKAMVSGGIIIAAIGILDDLNHIAAKWRLFTHLVGVIISLSMLPSLPSIPVLGFEFGSDIGIIVLLAVSLVWFVNLFNFMDGTDGIAGVEAITILCGGALILHLGGDQDWFLILGFLAACIAGFLVWNWAPAKVFMGDA